MRGISSKWGPKVNLQVPLLIELLIELPSVPEAGARLEPFKEGSRI